MNELQMQEAEPVRRLIIHQEPNPLAGTPAYMLQVAVEQGADLAKLEKLMELQERWEKNEARKAFVVALSAFKANPPELMKNKHVKFTSQKGVTEYDHATLDHVSSEIGKSLAAHGLSHRWDVEQQAGGIICVTCVLTHVLGHSERVPMQSLPDPSGGKNSIQAIGSTVTYLQRYTLLAATGVAVKGQDDDGKGSDEPTEITVEQSAEIKGLLQETESDVKKFLGVFGIESVDVMPPNQYDRAKNMLLRKKEKASGNS